MSSRRPPLLLLAVLLATFHVVAASRMALWSVSPQAANAGPRPDAGFPCADHHCGCATAEQCRLDCCCFPAVKTAVRDCCADDDAAGSGSAPPLELSANGCRGPGSVAVPLGHAPSLRPVPFRYRALLVFLYDVAPPLTASARNDFAPPDKVPIARPTA